MKYCFLILFLCLFQCADAKVEIGPAAGVNIFKVSGLHVSDSKFKVGVNAGGFLNIPLSDYFAVEVGALYVQKGFKVSATSPNLSYTQTTTLNYIEIPICIKYYFFDLYSFAGTYWAKALPQLGITSGDNPYFKNSDLGLNFGIGYQFDNGLNLRSQYCFGIDNINAQPASGQVHNMGLSFTATYFFNHRR